MRDAPVLRGHHTEIEVVHAEVVPHVEIIVRRDHRPRQKNTYCLLNLTLFGKKKTFI